ncbi:NAD(P)/FAD-dependent oxidoreductase [Photobacterium phosphoreum]|uniref:NAD(P)/FAD-dependent oxidoreductase n=1 Tax=Photobacterium phosphoreum TaxID=659 RepID=UPI000D174C0D|nr:NAD(P)/FAD-dependent oxidoreductase [Photobacterium phosphoreum]PSU58978.1 FAD-dependent oxidoreductase [Photobacterium phosphoreum]
MNQKQRTQVVIIGAGPSGSVAAALLHQQQIDVIILEKSTFPRFSIGESLLPACMAVIEQANMLDAVTAAGFQFKDGAAFRYQDRYTAFDFNDKFTPGAGTTYQVQRGHFDKVLADEAVAQGVELRYEHMVEAIECLEGKSILTVTDEQQQPYMLEADFVLDASGFGRVLPQLLDLEKPSHLPPRQAIFCHVTDHIDSNHCEIEYDRNKILISVHPHSADVWYWLIPFSNGTCSLGVVAPPQWLANYGDDPLAVLKQLINEEPGLATVLADAQYPTSAATISGYSANVTQLATANYALLGNAGEFLDPVFSSGVTIAMKSAQLAAGVLTRAFAGESIDWQRDYAEPLMVGVDTFRTYVEGWYSGELQTVIFHSNPDPKIKQMICAILAGYAWDTNNPFVTQSQRRLAVVAALCAD